ncbi:RdgB/HAM1 family non-canonical purine NTP pyrophosphatase [Hippea maritima]|uniref:dITP/XTP pyrophosphatase n=1 Tax=Hippea maritima (strain ATCC 700847 / DSM 10411 / MH2) TaxID=760142 RepID=F2LUS9_HIPMA|nr:RdgB/HAM1 family non-canonical purine NTP pyrophosphatase [Hippea maritima]AEA33534.1 Nucleoside-triphosphatase rdgB [Hippea maritima DSM 10411]
MPLRNSRIIVVATNNKHKLKEIKEILNDFEILPSSAVVDSFNPEESGKTFCENSLIKAKSLAEFTDYPVLADDSGLEVFSLNGEPGVYSSRYSKTGKDEDNLKKLIERLKGKKDRSARFSCCMSLVVDGNVIQREGYVYGRIIDRPIGENGFGYDPVFVPDGYDITFAQMSPKQKNAISHRRRALAMIKEELERIYG